MADSAVQQQETDPQASDAAADAGLSAQLDAKWAMGPYQVIVVVLTAMLFLQLNYIPLRTTDVWGHVSYGSWILEHRQLPTAPLFQPLAEGMQLTDGWWLSQVVFALVHRFGGADWLSNLFALTVTASYVLLGWAFYLESRHRWAALLAVGAALAVGWSRLTTVRPENFGLLCFAVLLCLVAGRQATDGGGRSVRRRRLWIGVPVLMALWANLHGSYVCGLAVLVCCFLGSSVETVKAEGFPGLWRSREVLGWFCLCELGLLASFLNPYGVGLLVESMRFAGQENLRDILEWQPLVILGVGGREFAASWLALLFVFRFSRRRICVDRVLLLLAFAVATVLAVRMIGWYAAAFGLLLAPHLAGFLERAWGTKPARSTAEQAEDEDRPVPTFALRGKCWTYSLVCLLLIWMAFAFSPMSSPLLGADLKTPVALYGADTPLELTEYLRSNPPRGQVFHPQEWGDWLVQAGPASFQPFVTSHVHVVPRQVWQDYLRVVRVRGNWAEVLDRYDVQLTIFDKSEHGSQARALRRQENWRKTYEDGQAIVFERTAPTPGPPDSAALAVDR